MNIVDVSVLMLMAAADICLIIHLRRRRARYIRMDRMTRSLQLHIRSQITAAEGMVAPRRRRILQRAS